MCTCSCRMFENILSVLMPKKFFKGFVFSTSYEYMFLLSFQGPGLVGCPGYVLF